MEKVHGYNIDDFKHPDMEEELAPCLISQKEKEAVLKQNKCVYENVALAPSQSATRHSSVLNLAPIMKVGTAPKTQHDATPLKTPEDERLQELGEMTVPEESEPMVVE